MEYEQDFYVPIKLKNIPSDAIILTPPPSHLKLTLKDKGFALLSYQFTHKLTPLTLNFEAKDGDGEVILSASHLFKDALLQKKLLSSTQLINIKPEKINYSFNYGLHKRVPLKFIGNFRTKPHYHYDAIKLKVDSITVFAQSNKLKNIQEVRTPKYTYSLSDSSTYTITLPQTLGIKYIPNKITFTAYSNRLTEKKIDIPIRILNQPKYKILRLFPSQVTIICQVGINHFKEVKPSQFDALVDYNDLKKYPQKLPIYLSNKPKQVIQYQLSPKSVEYLIENN